MSGLPIFPEASSSSPFNRPPIPLSPFPWRSVTPPFWQLTSTKKNSLAKEIWPRCGDLLTNTFNDILSKKTDRV